MEKQLLKHALYIKNDMHWDAGMTDAQLKSLDEQGLKDFCSDYLEYIIGVNGGEAELYEWEKQLKLILSIGEMEL